MSLDVAGYGFLAADADPRVSKNGKPWTRLRVGFGKGEGVIWLSVACFGRAAQTAAELKKGDKVYLEGQDLKQDTWRGRDGAERSGLSVTSFMVEQTHMIGRRGRRERESDDSPADESPPLRDSF
jgi:single-stranded DNA-binding protein